MTLGLAIWFAGGGGVCESQPAAPVSPELTNTEMPSAAAWLKRLSQKSIADRPAIASQLPKLMFMICATRLSTTYWVANTRPPPEKLGALPLTTNLNVDLGDTLIARMTSKVA